MESCSSFYDANLSICKLETVKDYIFLLPWTCKSLYVPGVSMGKCNVIAPATSGGE